MICVMMNWFFLWMSPNCVCDSLLNIFQNFLTWKYRQAASIQVTPRSQTSGGWRVGHTRPSGPPPLCYLTPSLSPLRSPPILFSHPEKWAQFPRPSSSHSRFTIRIVFNSTSNAFLLPFSPHLAQLPQVTPLSCHYYTFPGAGCLLFPPSSPSPLPLWV